MDAVHDSERWAQVRVPGILQLVALVREATFCKNKNIRWSGLVEHRGSVRAPDPAAPSKNWTMGRGGNLVVSVLIFYPDEPSSNPADCWNNFLYEKTKIKQEAGVVPSLKKELNWTIFLVVFCSRRRRPSRDQHKTGLPNLNSAAIIIKIQLITMRAELFQ